jgi:hypothetical protein
MKYIPILFVLLVSGGAKAQIIHRDTLYCLIGFNCTNNNGELLDGTIGVKCFDKYITARQMENEVMRRNKGLKRVIILAMTWMDKKEYYTYWSESNSYMNGKP